MTSPLALIRRGTWLMALLSAAAAARAEEPRTVQPPWHLVDLYWNPARTVTCEWFSVDVTIEGEVPTNLPLYIAPLGGGERCTINDTQCYGGLQTKPDGGRWISVGWVGSVEASGFETRIQG